MCYFFRERERLHLSQRKTHDFLHNRRGKGTYLVLSTHDSHPIPALLVTASLNRIEDDAQLHGSNHIMTFRKHSHESKTRESEEPFCQESPSVSRQYRFVKRLARLRENKILESAASDNNCATTRYNTCAVCGSVYSVRYKSFKII